MEFVIGSIAAIALLAFARKSGESLSEDDDAEPFRLLDLKGERDLVAQSRGLYSAKNDRLGRYFGRST